MPADQYGVDLGEAITTGQNIMKNKLLLQKAKDELETSNKLLAARQRLAAGDKSAMQDMLVLSPEESQRYAAAIGQMDENRRKQVEENLNIMGAAAATVLQAANPESAYQYVKSQFPAEVTTSWPQKYDQNWVAYHLAQAKDGLAMLRSMSGPPTKVTFGTKDILFDKNGNKIGETTSGEQVRHDDTQTQKSQELKSSDVNTIYKMASGLFGGTVSPITGEITLNQNDRPKAQAIATEAVQLYKTARYDMASAVSEAAKKFGVQMPGTQPAASVKPTTPWK